MARVSREVPELKEAIDSDKISVSQARRIVKVITPATQKEWITKAAELPQRQLEKEVAAAKPSAVRDRVRPVDAQRHELRASISERVKLKLDRAKDLLKKQVLEDVLEAALDALLEKKDPIKKAERTSLRKVKASSARIRHEVNLRDRGKCQVPGCTNTRFVELHHKKPRSMGGADSLDNLVTLCSAHHRMWHTHRTASPYGQGLSATAGPS